VVGKVKGVEVVLHVGNEVAAKGVLSELQRRRPHPHGRHFFDVAIFD